MNSLSRKGVIFGLITAICYAAYLLILRKTQAGRTDLSERNLATLTLITLLNLFFMACLAVITRESFNIPDAQSWLALLGYGVISQALAWVLICAGMAKVPLSQVGLLLILQPALAFIWDLLFFGRPTPPEEFIGVILVIFGIYLGTSYSSPPQKYGDNPRES
jgi:drug/metabolite transporter (DMT)-like permease